MIRHSSKNLLTLAIAAILALSVIAGLATLVGAQDGGLLPLPSRVFSQQSKPTGSTGAPQDDIGQSVAISADGNTAIVGMPGHDTQVANALGRAIVYVRTGATWTEQQILLASDGGGADAFGFSVDISANGTVAVIGAFGWENNDDGDGRGAAYVFRRTGGAWVQEKILTAADGTKFDKFGTAVAISGEGNHILVGATGEDSPTATVLGNGAVYAYTYGGGTTWTETAKIRPFADYQNDAFHLFGASIALSFNGTTAVIGAPGADPIFMDEGTAYVYTRAGNAWTKIATLTDIESDSGAAFGSSVATDNNGSVVMVGAPYADGAAEDSGVVVTYNLFAGNYLFNQRITGPGTHSAHFGASVTLNGNDGRVAVIGAPGDNASGIFSGAGYVYLRGNNQAWGQYAKLVPNDSAAGDNFGMSLDISADRLTVLGGSPNNLNKGAAYVFYDPQLVPTDIPTNTNTPGGPTETSQPPTKTVTPGGPTVTPIPPTNTPGGPTETPLPPTQTPTSTPPAVELLINGGFEQADAKNQPVGWTKKKDTKDKVKCSKDLSDPISYEALCVYQMKNINGLSGKLLQKVDVSTGVVKPGDTLRLEGAAWVANSKGKAKVKLVVIYTDPNAPKSKVVVNLNGASDSVKTWVPFVDLVDSDLIQITGTPAQIKVILLNKSTGGKIRYDAVSVKRYQAGTMPPPTTNGFGTTDTLPLP